MYQEKHLLMACSLRVSSTLEDKIMIFLEFPTTPLEMGRVADEFDKGDGMISAKEFMNALRFDPKKVIFKFQNEKLTNFLFSAEPSLKRRQKEFMKSLLGNLQDAPVPIASRLHMFLQKRIACNMGFVDLNQGKVTNV